MDDFDKYDGGDEFASVDDGEGLGGEPEAGAVADSAAQTAEDAHQSPEQRREHLTKMAARGGMLGELATELLAAAEERAAQVQRDELARQAAEADEAGVFPVDDPAKLREMFAAARQAEIADGDADYLRQREVALRRAGFADESVDEQLNSEKALLAETAWFEDGSEPTSNTYRAYERQLYEERRAREAVVDAWVNSRTLEDDAADAAAANAAMLADVLES